jgi:HK97 family phage major capsid protein
MFNTETWLTESIAEAFAVAEGDAVIRGNGSNKPTGMLNSAPTAVADEPVSRAAAVYQFILGADNSPAAVDADTLIDLAYTVN